MENKKNYVVILFGILLILECCAALEYNKQQRLNSNTDFLLHEGGVPNNGPKRDYVAPQPPNSQSQQNLNTGNQDYLSQFPALGSPTGSSLHSSTTTAKLPGHNGGLSSNGKRDYVAPQFTTPKPVQNNHQVDGTKWGYVTPSFPAPKPVSNNQNANGPKRDYVAPQFPTLRPVQENNMAGGKRDYVSPQPGYNSPSTGKVKDLINFYDNKKAEPGLPSYSSILQGNNKNGMASSSTTGFTKPVTQSTPTTKPINYSSALAGSNKSGTSTTFTSTSITTPRTPVSRPGTPVLPSSIVNKQGTVINGNTVTNEELRLLSEELLRKDTNNAAKYITVNYQERTTSQDKTDKAPRPLLTISPEVWNIPTIQKFVPLLDNYEKDTLINEYVTPQERNEENAFMDTIMSTSVMRHLMTFLRNKGYVTPDVKQQRDFVKQLWFSLYSRGKGKISSSAFEHVFVSEIKGDNILGFHNWIYFSKEEAANRVNYLGFMKHLELNDKGAVLKYHFNSNGVDKPVNTMFIGTSPELEIALYTLCFVTRFENDCKLKLGNKDVDIVTHNFRYRSKNLIGSSYPQI